MHIAYGMNYTLFYQLHIGKGFKTFRLVNEGFALEFRFVWVSILTAWSWRIEI